MRKAGALIRGVFGIDPWQLSDEKFANLLGEAIWLKHYESQQMENTMMKVLSKAFGDGG